MAKFDRTYGYDMSKEIWKWIPGYSGYYKVSNWGRVKSVDRRIRHKSKSGVERQVLKPGRILKYIKSTLPYAVVGLYDSESKLKTHLVHRLVLTAFVPKEASSVRHECRHYPEADKFNNRLDNLRWGTSSQNKEDNRKQGTLAQGNQLPHAKLTSQSVRRIRKTLSRKFSFDKVHTLAGLYGVTYTSVMNAYEHITWKHVD